MIKYEVIFLEMAKDFLDKLDIKTREKVIYNIWKLKEINDPELFKKLTNEIWEFRTNYLSKKVRLLAFWDKEKNNETLVVATHGFIKKTQKIPKQEIEKAKQLITEYYIDKKREKK